MASPGVVPFNEGSDDPFGVNQALEAVMPDALSLDRADHPFRNGIPLRIAHVGVGKLEAKPPCVIHEEMSGILGAMIELQFDAGNDGLLKGAESVDGRHLQGVEGSPCGAIFCYPVADDRPVVMIDDGEEPAPAILFSPELRPVRAPHHVRLGLLYRSLTMASWSVMMGSAALPLVALHEFLYPLLPDNKVPVESKHCPYPPIAVVQIIGVPDYPLDLPLKDLVRCGRLRASSLMVPPGSLLLHPVPSCSRYLEYLADHRDRVRGTGELIGDLFRASSIRTFFS